MSSAKPLAVSMGDPAGIGPEVVLKAVAGGAADDAGPFLLVGSPAVFEGTARALGLDVELPAVASAAEFLERGLAAGVLAASDLGFSGEFGRLTPESAGAAAGSAERAARLAIEGECAAVVTAPLTKEGLALAGRDFPGHTEMLADLCGCPGDELMMLVGGGLRVALVTTHLAIADVPGAIGAELIAARLGKLESGLRADFGVDEPRIAVLALNPHAGEGGRFGDEEAAKIVPALESCRAGGVRAEGPLPADTAFHRALAGEFDAVLAMYHDQGLAVLKALAFDSGVNVTLGLPVVRTSPDHGTAYDIAGSGRASERSTVEALKLARAIANRRGPSL
ncbi:MAG: 4-hydroxythreonine-4-phosphate dehydrogenase PdxA [Planctomycetota bacterium]|jgi:4-hydroxythreonine-4-phosphate dehydrogenase